jgi:hypothetical protein
MYTRGIFFVTSEQYPGEARHFKVRQYWPDTGGITTHQGYSKGIVRAKALAVTAAAKFTGMGEIRNFSSPYFY